MTPTAEIERMVRAVLAELTASRQAPPAEMHRETASGPESGVCPATAEGELRLDARLITKAEVAGRLEGVRRVVVSPQAIVTPSVRDELRRRDVVLARTSPSGIAAAGQLRLEFVVACKRFDAAPLADALAAEGVAVQQQRMDCLIAATDHLAAEALRPNTLAALASRHWAAALCLANRHPGVRAVVGLDPARSAAATADVGANLLVIDTAAGTLFQWKQMLIDFCRSGVRPCPAAIEKRLG